MQNPKAPFDRAYIFHAKYPRFIAEITQENLVVIEVFDEAPQEQVMSKLKRMNDWFQDYVMNKTKYDEHRSN
jgi:hypothetical protein